MKKIVAIGEILVEIMASDRRNGFREPLRLLGPFPSGAPAIFIDQAARFGQPCAMVGCVGEDDFGLVNLDRLRRDGVDVRGIAIDPEFATGSAFVRYRQDGSRDFVFNIKHSACGRIALGEEARSVIAGCDHIHVMGTALFSASIVSATLKAIGMVKRNGGTVSFDPNLRAEMLDLPGLREALDTVFAEADLFLPSGPELFLFTRTASRRAAIAEILSRGIKAVVIKHGAEGASYHDPAVQLHQPAFTVTEVDPTGAGDCFGAIFVSCWLRNMDPARALRYAAASGARAVEQQGPMEGASTMAELDAFLASHNSPAASNKTDGPS